jgi:hypothetical protein
MRNRPKCQAFRREMLDQTQNILNFEFALRWFSHPFDEILESGQGICFLLA